MSNDIKCLKNKKDEYIFALLFMNGVNMDKVLGIEPLCYFAPFVLMRKVADIKKVLTDINIHTIFTKDETMRAIEKYVSYKIISYNHHGI